MPALKAITEHPVGPASETADLAWAHGPAAAAPGSQPITQVRAHHNAVAWRSIPAAGPRRINIAAPATRNEVKHQQASQHQAPQPTGHHPPPTGTRGFK
ncbi:hypothetical protein NDU88_002875 [Pleurodeles waltl]|uniref:Uncharacterized protein n=1 Tax=Pleurodeles waltl TaxID=8319 RepID=A0AAV7MSN4_PLEWA|nr:hypothetical protein NDU88_002875 [Pleurodeles waltl]